VVADVAVAGFGLEMLGWGYELLDDLAMAPLFTLRHLIGRA
jgi:hypothetical protein